MFADLSAALPTAPECVEFAKAVTERARKKLLVIDEAFPEEPDLKRLGHDLFLAIHLFRQETAFNKAPGPPREALKAVRKIANKLKIALDEGNIRVILATALDRRYPSSLGGGGGGPSEPHADFWRLLDELPEIVGFALELDDWKTRSPNPVQTLLGRSLPKLAQVHFGICDTFDRADDSESPVTLFVQAVIEEANIGRAYPLDSIGTYISNERGKARARVKRRRPVLGKAD
jgi:hypothetical protein